MSTKHNALYAYGLHLDKKDLCYMYAHYFDEECPALLADIVTRLGDTGLIDYESDFTGEAFPLDMAGRPCWQNVLESYQSEPMGYVVLCKQPTLLHGAYPDISVAVMELRNIMNGLLPEDFDYYGNLCLILGTYYG